jgi:hypothetical protein
MVAMLAVALVISAVVLLVAFLKTRLPASSDFLNGLTTGLSAALPLGMGLFLYLAYRRMDEYGQRVQQQAAATGFLYTMMATMVGYAVSSGTELVIPLWTLYVFGMLVFAVSVVVRRLRGS